MKAAFFVLLAAIPLSFGMAAASGSQSTQGQPANTPPSTRYDLNGEWQAEYHDPGSLDVERVMIVDYGNGLVATKETGDVYVPAGKVTFTGNYTSNPFPIQMESADKGFTNPRWEQGVTLTVLDADHFNVAHANGSVDQWHRIGKPTLALDDAILFDVNKYDLKPEASAALDKIVTYLGQMHPASRFLVAGYTDDTGAAALNLTLSQRRARSVAAALKARGIAAARLDIKGYGTANPRYPNINDDARAHNRRVEIVVQN